MHLFAKTLELYKQKQEEQKKKLAFLPAVEYIGGYEGKNKAIGSVTFFRSNIEFKVVFRPKASFTIQNTDISSISIEGKDEVQSRVTVTRLLAVGIFAFALKKNRKDKEAFLVIALKNGQEVIFHLKNISPMELRAKLSQVTIQSSRSFQNNT